MTLISIAMTTYNGESYLAVQLASLKDQTRQPDEIVICDDRSTDRTLQLLEDFAASAPFSVLVVSNQTNLGHELNFAKAVDLCTGDIIFLADQDDQWNLDRLEVVEQYFAADANALVIVNDVMITDGALVPTGRTILEQTRAAGVLGRNGKSLTLGCATAFRSGLRELISPIPALNYGHDSWIHDFTEALGARRVIPEVLQLYRRHGGNVSSWAFNGSERASPLVVMQPSAGQDLTAAYANRIRALSLMLERVRAMTPDCYEQVNRNRSRERVISELERSVRSVKRRMQVFRRGWLGRKLLAIGLLIRGDYRHFLGWRSFAKDLVR